MRIMIAALMAFCVYAIPATSLADGHMKPSGTPPLTKKVQNDATFLTGGLGDEELAKLRAMDDDYNVRVVLTREDGAYLSKIDIVITDREGKTLIETNTRGPIFLAELKPGRYFLRASTEGRTTEKRSIDIPTVRDQVRLYVALESKSD